MRRPSAPVGVVLAAGSGSRMGPLGSARAKVCLPVCNEPLIAVHLRQLTAAGARRVVLVVGHQRAQVVAEAERHAPTDLELRVAIQAAPRGIADALMLAAPYVSERCIAVLGDTYYQDPDLKLGDEVLRRGDAGGDLAAVLSVREVEDPGLLRKECSVRLGPTGRVAEIREKPAVPFSLLKPCGIYFFRREIFAAVAETPASSLRGEVELTDAIQRLIEQGQGIGVARTLEWDVNLNQPADLLAANRAELQRRGLANLVDESARVHDSAILDETVVGAGAVIGAGARLERCVIFAGARVAPGERLTDQIRDAQVAAPDSVAARPGGAPVMGSREKTGGAAPA